MNCLFHLDWQRWQDNWAKKCPPQEQNQKKKKKQKTETVVWRTSEKEIQLADQDIVLPLVGIWKS